MRDSEIRDFLPYADYVPYLFWPILVWPVVLVCALLFVVFAPPKWWRE